MHINVLASFINMESFHQDRSELVVKVHLNGLSGGILSGAGGRHKGPFRKHYWGGEWRLLRRRPDFAICRRGHPDFANLPGGAPIFCQILIIKKK